MSVPTSGAVVDALPVGASHLDRHHHETDDTPRGANADLGHQFSEPGAPVEPGLYGEQAVPDGQHRTDGVDCGHPAGWQEHAAREAGSRS